MLNDSRQEPHWARRVLRRIRDAWWPEPVALPPKARWLAVAAATVSVLAVMFASRLLGASSPLLVAAVGASAVVLFALPASPLAKPWALVGSYVVCALAGVTAVKLFDDPALAGAAAVGLALAGMLWLRCLHPPGGAVALFAVTGGERVHELGYAYALAPALANALLLLAVTPVISRTFLGGRRPHPRPADHHVADAPPLQRLGLSHDDVQAALAEYGSAVYIGSEDLDRIIELAEERAWQRQHGEVTCADVMSRDVVTVSRQASLAEAWELLDRHRLTALPVVDGEGRLEGLLGLADFVECARPSGLRRRLLNALAQPRNPAGRPVAAAMGSVPAVVLPETRLATLVPLLAGGLHQIVVTDPHRRVVGLITQSDLIAALYRLDGRNGIRRHS